MALVATWSLLAAGQALAAPAVTVTSAVAPGGTLTVSGTGFGANEVVELRIDGALADEVVTDATGAFSGFTIRLSRDIQPGTHRLTAVGRRTQTAAQKAFVVRTMWLQERQGPARRAWNVHENTISPANVARLEEDWTAGTGPVYSEPAVRGGVLTFLQRIGTTTRFIGVNADTGAPRFNIVSTAAPHGTPAMGSATIYVALGSTLRAYSYGGALVWSANLGAEAAGGPTLDGARVLVGDATGRLQAFPASCGSSTCAAVWRTAAEGAVNAGAPAVGGGRAFTFRSGYYSDGEKADQIEGYSLGCTGSPCPVSWRADRIDLWTGVAISKGLLWSWSASRTATGFPVHCDPGCPFASAVGLSSAGHGSGFGGPAVGEGRVVGAATDLLSVVDERCRVVAESGCTPVWTTNPPAGTWFHSSPTIANGLIYVTDGQRNVRAYPLDCSTGCPPAWIAHSAATQAAPIVVNGRLYQGTENGVRTYALDAGARHVPAH